MTFVAHTQEQLRALKITANQSYKIEYLNKDYFNAEESIERGNARAVLQDENIYFNVRDPYGMEKLVMQARVIGYGE